MAALSRFAEPHQDYFDWNAPPAGGFVLMRTNGARGGALRDKDRWLCGGTDMNILYAMLGGFALDLAFWRPGVADASVVIMGKPSARWNGLRRACRKRQRGERLGGLTLALCCRSARCC